MNLEGKWGGCELHTKKNRGFFFSFLFSFSSLISSAVSVRTVLELGDGEPCDLGGNES